jgi:hypothetical protein
MTSTTPASSRIRPRIEIAHPPALKGVIMAIRPNPNNSAPNARWEKEPDRVKKRRLLLNMVILNPPI